MLLTISTTATDHGPATDLGHLLHKHPDRVQRFEQSFGTATVLYPEASAERCTAMLALEVDPVALARGRGRRSPDVSLAHYVNDRPYAASSLLGVALADVFSTARAGVSRSHPELAAAAIPLELHLPVLPCRGGPELAERIFAPLGWTLRATPVPLDERFPGWGDSRYLDLHLTGTVRLADALSQLHLLLPVLDEAKHYWQAPDEVDKLVRGGGAWLAAHPERELIVRRYLSHRRSLQREALTRLAELDDRVDHDDSEATGAEEPGTPEAPRVPLVGRRHEAVLAVLTEAGARSVIDLGCGAGAFLFGSLVPEPSFERITGCDVSVRALSRAARRREDLLSEHRRERVTLVQAALTYADDRLAGYDAAVLMEVVEHVDPPRLSALERVVLGGARPGLVVVTTPNADHNVLYPDLEGHRHDDHRFEWTRAEFAAWSDGVASAYGYEVTRHPVGEVHPEHGAPTQMAVLRRRTDG